MDELKRQLQFGPVSIEWELPASIRTPFGVPYEPELLERENVFVTLCPVVYRRDGLEGSITVDRDFVFDGASIPRHLWRFKGFAPCGPHIWAALCHDWLCERSKIGKCDRVLADAVFAALLEHTGVKRERAWLMELAVSLYRWHCRLERKRPT